MGTKGGSHLNDAGLKLFHGHLLLGLRGGAHHLPLHHAVLLQGSLVLVEHAFLVPLTQVLHSSTTTTETDLGLFHSFVVEHSILIGQLRQSTVCCFGTADRCR